MCPAALLELGPPVSSGCVGPVGVPPSPACPSSSSVPMSIAPLCSLPAFGRGALLSLFFWKALSCWRSVASTDTSTCCPSKASMPAGSVVALSCFSFPSTCCSCDIVEERGAVPGVLAPHSDLDQIHRTSASWMGGLMHGDSSGAPCKGSSARNRQRRAEGVAFLQRRHTKGGL